MIVNTAQRTAPVERAVARVITLPPPKGGQFGPDHTVIEVITPEQWAEADPFILLMDDRIDGKLVGGPHPHAGFETVTFLVDGRMGSEGGAGALAPGDVEWTTAGRGIVHGSSGIEGKMRVLQLWVTLPKALRWTEPDHQMVPAAEAPVRRERGAEVRLFSGATGTLRSPTRNRVPMTLVDVRLEPGAAVEQAVPPGHNGFLYVLEGEVRVGAEGTPLKVGQVGWLDRRGSDGGDDGTLRIGHGGSGAARVLLYTGERQGVPIVSYGPFIGDSKEDIARSYKRYRDGAFQRY